MPTRRKIDNNKTKTIFDSHILVACEERILQNHPRICIVSVSDMDSPWIWLDTHRIRSKRIGIVPNSKNESDTLGYAMDTLWICLDT